MWSVKLDLGSDHKRVSYPSFLVADSRIRFFPTSAKEKREKEKGGLWKGCEQHTESKKMLKKHVFERVLGGQLPVIRTNGQSSLST
jgi:hypothetical protein